MRRRVPREDGQMRGENVALGPLNEINRLGDQPLTVATLTDWNRLNRLLWHDIPPDVQ